MRNFRNIFLTMVLAFVSVTVRGQFVGDLASIEALIADHKAQRKVLAVRSITEGSVYALHNLSQTSTSDWKHINIELDNGYLTVRAAKGVDKDEMDNKGRIIRQERYSGAMQRSFYVGNALTEEDITARYENGVLQLNVPKMEARKLPEKKTIMIEG